MKLDRQKGMNLWTNRGPHLHTYRFLLVTFVSDSGSLDAAGTDHISGVF